MKTDNSYDEISEINMTPFVDIVLVILVIFMATATFVAQGKIAISLPKVSSYSDNSTIQNPTIITIDKNGNIYLNDKESQPQKIDEYFTNNKEASKESVILRSDAQTAFEHIVKVVDICKKNNISKFAIQTQEVKQ